MVEIVKMNETKQQQRKKNTADRSFSQDFLLGCSLC